MPHPYIREILANPPGTDKGHEWVELCADTATNLAGYGLKVGMRTLQLQGVIPAHACSLARTGTAAIRNREADVSLLYNGMPVQAVRTAGAAPEGQGFHVGTASFWATSTPGMASGTPPVFPPLPDLAAASSLPGLLGTAACTAGILTLSALAVLRHARTRHDLLEGGDPAPGR